MSDSRWMEMAPAFVLGMLDAEETRAFEERLAGDAELRAEVRAQREVLGVIADGTERHAPPSALKERILERARDSAPKVDGRTADPIPIAPRRPLLPWLVATAATVAALSFGMSAYQSGQRASELAARLEASESVAEERATALAARDSILESFLGPDVQSATLASTGAAPSARVFLNSATGSVVIAAFDLPPAPDGRTYQLWGIADGENPVSLGTFQTTETGTAILRRTVPAGTTFAVGAVTEEPAGGSPQPTSTPFLVGSWTQD